MRRYETLETEMPSDTEHMLSLLFVALIFANKLCSRAYKAFPLILH